MENLSSESISQDSETISLAAPNQGRKWLNFAGPVLVLVLSFLLGSVYFFNLDALARYYITKEALPLEIDSIDLGIDGKFELERFKYKGEFIRGVEEQMRFEFAGGKISLPGIIFSNKVKLEVELRGVKIPLSNGLISGGAWKLNIIIDNISKTNQLWTGDAELVAENAIVQIKIMNSDYVAAIKKGTLKGKIRNGQMNFDTSDINADIAKITVSGNAGIGNPYNINLDLKILPLDAFGEKYPNEKSMLSAIMQKESEIQISLAGPINNIRPRVKNLNMPGL